MSDSDSSLTLEQMKATNATIEQIDDLVDEVSQFLERYDCQNPDLTIDPFELLRDCKKAMLTVEDAFTNLKCELEGQNELHAEENSKLRKEIATLKANQSKFESLPWIRPYLNG